MSEYTLDDKTFTSERIDEIPPDSNKDEKWDMEDINKRSMATWLKLEHYEHEYEERIKTGILR